MLDFAQSIITTSSGDLLAASLLPLSTKLADKARDVYARELALKSYLMRYAAAAASDSATVESPGAAAGGGSNGNNGSSNVGPADHQQQQQQQQQQPHQANGAGGGLAGGHGGRDKDKETMENDLQRDFEMLVRNIYAFYPLLIKYVDIHKTHWLKHVEPNAERLYMHVADVFNIWLKSKMFKKEEANFVAINNIDNMSLINPNKSAATAAGTLINNTMSNIHKIIKNKAFYKVEKIKYMARY